MIKKYLWSLVICLLAGNALASVGVFPQSLYFETNSKQKSQTITVINETDEPQAYKISVKDYMPDENGQMKEVETTDRSAKNYIMFSPRRFTLPPHKTQNVRVAIRKTAEAKDGEYTSFLHIAETENNFGKKQEEKKDEEEGMSVSIKMYMATAIPVTVAKGNLVAKTDIVSYKKNGDKIDVELQRQGTKSSRVNVIILGSKDKELGRANQVVIAKPNGTRVISIDLKNDEEKTKPSIIKLEDAITKKEILRKEISL